MTLRPEAGFAWLRQIIFPAEGAHPYKRDLKNLEFHLLDTGHFALEEDGDVIANHMRRFLDKNVVSVRLQN